MPALRQVVRAAKAMKRPAAWDLRGANLKTPRAGRRGTGGLAARSLRHASMSRGVEARGSEHFWFAPTCVNQRAPGPDSVPRALGTFGSGGHLSCRISGKPGIRLESDEGLPGADQRIRAAEPCLPARACPPSPCGLTLTRKRRTCRNGRAFDHPPDDARRRRACARLGGGGRLEPGPRRCRLFHRGRSARLPHRRG